jgi:hypothetical protein
MTTKQQPIRIGMSCHVGLGAAAIITICALPVLAQAPSCIPGVLAPGVVSELVQEGFTFTEGPVGTADGGPYFSDIRVSKTTISIQPARSPWFARTRTAQTASR